MASCVSIFGAALLGLVALSFQAVLAQEYYTIESPKVTDWGSWGELEVCPEDSFVFGYRLKVEPYQTITSDDCALNGIELLCTSPMKNRGPTAPLNRSNRTGLLSKAFGTVVSSVGHRGDWGPITECPEPLFAVGFHLRSEEDQGWYADDTAANDLKLICSDGYPIEVGNGLPYGNWSPEIKCPRGHYLCGIQTQVEDEQS
jgi:hypothetical protein